MGKGVSIKCKRCDYSATLFEGVGFRTQDFKVFRRELTKKRNDSIDFILSNKKIYNISYYNAYAKCNKCGNLATVPYVEINYDDNKIFKLEYSCEICKSKYKLVSEEEIVSSRCPICNYENLQNSRSIFWD
ncbi:hypothetical protein [Clostridium sp.]|uniref:hypothetical protein n=1 Tax=Clostridium sp. TaxID=1506 RepID=UPI0025BD19F2|nr:hypothetical protein [Clostridium sp.]